jgi:hypothetical protein
MDDDQEIRRLETEAYEKWRAKYGEDAAAIEARRSASGAIPYEELDELKARYPDAMREYIGLILFSPDVVRKMRLQSPRWVPPQSFD